MSDSGRPRNCLQLVAGCPVLPGAEAGIVDGVASAGCLGGFGDEVERGGVGELSAGEHGGLGDAQVVKELLDLSGVGDREYVQVLVPGAGLNVRGWCWVAAVRGQDLARAAGMDGQFVKLRGELAGVPEGRAVGGAQLVDAIERGQGQ